MWMESDGLDNTKTYFVRELSYETLRFDINTHLKENATVQNNLTVIGHSNLVVSIPLVISMSVVIRLPPIVLQVLLRSPEVVGVSENLNVGGDTTSTDKTSEASYGRRRCRCR